MSDSDRIPVNGRNGMHSMPSTRVGLVRRGQVHVSKE